MDDPREGVRLEALVDAGMALASEFDLPVLLQRVADTSRQVLGARYAAVGVLDERGRLKKFIYSGVDQATVERIGRLPEGQGVLGVVIEEGKPLRLKKVSEHERAVGFPEHHPVMHSFLGVPIKVRDRIFGRIYLTEKEGAATFTEEDERIALLLAAQAGVAIENSELLEQLRARGEQLAVLEERDRIAKELHDGVIQSIYSVGLSLQSVDALMDKDLERARLRLREDLEDLDRVINDVRRYIFQLEVDQTASQELGEMVVEMVQDFSSTAGFTAEVRLDAEACRKVPPDQRGHVLQMLREIVSNLTRHSLARTVSISCVGEATNLVLVVQDDGSQFDPATVKRGHGLDNLEERARQLGGSILIEPMEEGGMRHQIRIPLDSSDD